MKYTFIILFIIISTLSFAQPTGYYNGTEGKTGDELKSELNNIISDHMVWYYFYAKKIFLSSDADPANPGNVITVYKGTSVDGANYGTGGNYLNREHVWAKSHGQFGEEAPTGADVHNLKPADGSVNVDRSNKDFDNCQENGQQHDEAIGCYFTSDAWEPRDEVKGDIARIIFYMATRYEGENGEVDLEVNDEVDNSPDPFHGRLSALLEWNEQDPPDNFERNRNNVIFGYQQNRNPYIDNPEWVNMIWDNGQVDDMEIGNIAQSVELPKTGDAVEISATINGTGTVSAVLNWGTSYTSLTNNVSMAGSGSYSATIPSQSSETDIFYQIVATDDNGTASSVVYQYHVEGIFDGEILSIAAVQGEQEFSPYEGQEVTITGVVTGNFGEGFFIQDGQGAWNGIYVYDVINPQIGDSVIITGTVVEYTPPNETPALTEIKEVSDYYLISRGNELPSPEILTIGEVSEAYEGVLINIQNGTCTNDDAGYGMWEVADNTGTMKIHNTQIYEVTPQVNDTYSVTGPCTWNYSEWKIELRMESDVQEGFDEIAPCVDTVQATSQTNVSVFFTEPVDQTTAEQASNYVFNDGIEVTNVTLNTFTFDMVIITVTGLTNGNHEITISNVEDLAGNAMEPVTIPFTAVVGIDAIESLGLKMYPNPVTNRQLFIENTREVSQIMVSDVAGRTIQTISNTDKQTSIIISNLPQGVHFVKIITKDNQIGVSKIIVE